MSRDFDDLCHAVQMNTTRRCAEQYCHAGLHADETGETWSDAQANLCAAHPKHYPSKANPGFKTTASR